MPAHSICLVIPMSGIGIVLVLNRTSLASPMPGITLVQVRRRSTLPLDAVDVRLVQLLTSLVMCDPICSVLTRGWSMCRYLKNIKEAGLTFEIGSQINNLGCQAQRARCLIQRPCHSCSGRQDPSSSPRWDMFR